MSPRRPTIVDFPEMPQIPRLSPLIVRNLLLAILAIAIAVSGFYTVEPEQEAVITRFGRYDRTADPGLHFKLPLGIEQVQKVAVQRQLKQEFGFRTTEVGIRSQFSSVGYESSMLTGDLNAAVVEWVVQYRVIDSFKFLFRVRAVEDTFRDMSEAVMRAVVGDRTVNEVLTIGRQEIEDLVLQRLQQLAEQYETGIRVEQVVLQTVDPPEPVKASFNEVNQAEQERERLINEAQSEYNKLVPRAEGEARQAIQQAEGYALDRINRAKGEAARFEALYNDYRNAPEVTRTRIYLETMGRTLPKAGRKVVVDGDLKGLIPLLNMGGAVTPPGAGGGG
jgi:modulator of FtsH protease HflK